MYWAAIPQQLKNDFDSGIEGAVNARTGMCAAAQTEVPPSTTHAASMATVTEGAIHVYSNDPSLMIGVVMGYKLI